MKHEPEGRVKTGVENLDLLLQGGLPRHTLTVLGGMPGSGKTILSQQICFANATPSRPAVIFNTLSESTPKTLRYARPFAYFDEKAVGKSIHFVDLGDILRTRGLPPALEQIMVHMRKLKPALVVIDSFKTFDELSQSSEDLRKFTYEVAISLMAWECTALLLGEFAMRDIETKPLFSVVDGIIMLASRDVSGERQRFVQVVKMRGTNHSPDSHPMRISDKGLSIYAPRVQIRRRAEEHKERPGRFRFGIETLDQLMGAGVPYGSSLLISGAPGTGKSLLALETIYRGAKEQGEKGLFFSYNETPDRLLAMARELGWSLEKELKRGMAKIIFVPQPEILVEADLLRIEEEIKEFGAKRVAVDSLSTLLHKVSEPALLREKVYQLDTIIQRAGAVGLLTSSAPADIGGIEETVVDGIIRLTLVEKGLDSEGYVEVCKLRGTKHLRGRHPIEVGEGGLVVAPRA